MKFTIKKTIEVDVVVDCDYTPAKSGKRTLSNGDPGTPDDPAELAINSVKLGDLDITPQLKAQDFDLNALSEDLQAESKTNFTKQENECNQLYKAFCCVFQRLQNVVDDPAAKNCC